MARLEKLDFGSIESICRILGDTSSGFTGAEIAKLLYEAKIEDIDASNTKWKRLNSALANRQELDGCANAILHFIQLAMAPSKHYNNQEWFNDTRFELNKVLSFSGYSLGENGKVSTAEKAYTISEAAARANKLKEHLISRNVHPDVLHYCREELLVDNYFHAVFEATKSVADKIRNKTGLTSDGAGLVNEAFAFKNAPHIPHLALNTLQTDSEKSEQKGFVNLLVGLFGTFRNTTAHAPKVTWLIDERDALDILSMVSLVHRRLDKAIEAKKMYENKI
ncbi:TIGR02391 family protein [Vibrio parahaemolyticus]|uniref:TIGR02391 family protein n=2 Tax=Vibrio parahaemolyticus TaxID=670 RepID=UPI00111DBEE2|nr:TIGR02391 family protein [Vibrio parahaemolyticus]EGQ8808917.1 TIGR02391 family protein [Vibrio parahaemolyticus]EGQ8893232.1 TIGR02391 family protein [Vibrio parahaemolyticus]EGQ8967277.1 TIGR02391 family protein [Vibrio parahaemolyticus]EGR2855791.1 TIGR02391 family protein [Vibrio parahaemolyticus]EGR3167189.1 TIGR02391 family protein [Vibrio parahaemolyticus]